MPDKRQFLYPASATASTCLRLVPVLAWGILQYLLYRKLGVQFTADALFRFLPYAKDIATDFHFGLGQDIRYAGYTSLLAVFIKADIPSFYLVALQAALSLMALLLTQRIVEALTNSRLCAFMAAMLVATCQDIQQWNYYVLTESVFTSALIFCFAVLILCKSRLLQLLSLPFWFFTCIIRPNGFIMVAAALLYYFLLYFPTMSQSTRRKLWLGAGTTFVLSLVLLNQLLGPFTLVETYARGEVIYGTSFSSLTPPGSSFYRILPPNTLQMPPSDASALHKLLLFFWHNPLFFLKLALAKGTVFLAFAKPHFSKIHNLFIFVTVYPCYLLAFKTLRNRPLRPVVLSLFSIIGLQTMIVMFTVEDWDCRFIAPILPFLFILGALGLKEVFRKRLPAWDRVDTQRN